MPFFGEVMCSAIRHRMSANSGTRVRALSTAMATLFPLKKRTGGQDTSKKNSGCSLTALRCMKSGGNYFVRWVGLAVRATQHGRPPAVREQGVKGHLPL